MEEGQEKREMDDEDGKTKESSPNNIRILSVYSRSKDDGLMKPPPPPPPRPSPVSLFKGAKVTRDIAPHATLTKMSGSNALTKGQNEKGNLKRPSTHDEMEMRIKMAKINCNAANKKTNIPVVDLHGKCRKDVEVHLKEKQLMETKYAAEIGRLKRLNQSYMEEIEKKKKENTAIQEELGKLRAKEEEKERTLNNLKKSMNETRERLHESEQNVKKLKAAFLSLVAKNKKLESGSGTGTGTETEGSASSPSNSEAQAQIVFLKLQLRKHATAMKELYLKYESQKMELSCRCPDCGNLW